jgi:Spy/CpxP family protein refolding chaperone
MNYPRPKLRLRGSTLLATTLAIVCLMVLCVNLTSAQALRRQIRMQKRIDKKLNPPANNPKNKLSSQGEGSEDPNGSAGSAGSSATNDPGAGATKPGAQSLAPTATNSPIAGRQIQGGHSLDGIRQRGIRTLFTKEESSLLIPGFGNSPVAMLVILRQLDLTPDQKVKIRNIRRDMGNRLQLNRRELNQLESQLEEAIYGNLDPASLNTYDSGKVKELTEQVVQKRAEVFRLTTDVESQFRQILTPDQFFVFSELVREMVLPGRRPQVNPAARQQQQQRRMQNPQNRPNQQDPPDGA